MAATADRDTKSKSIEQSVAYPMKAATKIFDGTMVGLVIGYAQPAGDVAGMEVKGVADWQVDNIGAAGAKVVRLRRGVFKFTNGLSGEKILQADIQAGVCYAIDDQTVGKVGGTNKVIAGEPLSLDDGGLSVWVKIPNPKGPQGEQGEQGEPGA